MKNKLIAGLLIGLLFGMGYSALMYFKPHQNIYKSKPYLILSAQALIESVENNSVDSKNDLLGKIVQINGEVNNINEQNDSKVVSFDFGGNYIVQAYLDESEAIELASIIGKNIELKGKYVGVIINDEDFLIPADIKLEQCFIIK